MGLADALIAVAAAHAHVFLVEIPGELALLLHADRQLRERGLVRAHSPADADVLLVCGELVDTLREPVEAVWESMGEPRSRAQVHEPSFIPAALAAAQAELRNTPAQRESARIRPGSATPASDSAGTTGEGQDTDDGDDDMGGDDMDMEMGGNDMDMEMAPSGIPLAGGAEDRDGLEMDVLRLPLGPVLAHWPAGLKLTCTIAGDLVTAATVEAPATLPRGPEGLIACHGLAAALSLAGWPAGARLARQACDSLLLGEWDAAHRNLGRLQTRLRRHVVLGWTLRGVATIEAPDAERLGLPPQMCGDASDRLQLLARMAINSLGSEYSRHENQPPPAESALLEALPELVTGLEVAAARLLVASCVPLLVALAAEQAGG